VHWSDVVLDSFLTAAAAFLLLNVLIGLIRVVRGPSMRDRLLALLLLSTTGVAVLALLAVLTGLPALRDAALALVALATLIVVVRVTSERAER
jgi:multicomponent Na+:H+ antiporter subunit F